MNTTKVRNARASQKDGQDTVYRLNDIPFDVDSLPKVGGPLLKKCLREGGKRERGRRERREYK